MGDDDDKAEFMMKAFVDVFWMLFGKSWIALQRPGHETW
jgi:hypothetical protein